MSIPESTYAVNQPARANVTRHMDRILDVPRCRMWYSTGIVAFGPGGSNMPFNAVDYDTDGMANPTSTVFSSINCRTTGLYLCAGGLEWSGGAGVRQTKILRTSVTFGNQSFATASTTPGNQHNVSEPIQLAAGDSIQLAAFAGVDSSDIIGGTNNMYLSACLISLLGAS